MSSAQLNLGEAERTVKKAAEIGGFTAKKTGAVRLQRPRPVRILAKLHRGQFLLCGS